MHAAANRSWLTHKNWTQGVICLMHWYADTCETTRVRHKHKQLPYLKGIAVVTTVCLFLCGWPIQMGGFSKPALIHLICWTQEPGLQTKSSFTRKTADYSYMWSQESLHHTIFLWIPPPFLTSLLFVFLLLPQIIRNKRLGCRSDMRAVETYL